MHVLIVASEAEQRRRVAGWIDRCGNALRSIQAADILEAVERIEHQPQLALVLCVLPLELGGEARLAQHLRQSPNGAPMILLTRDNEDEISVVALNMGGIELIPTCKEPETLIYKLLTCLQRVRQIPALPNSRIEREAGRRAMVTSDPVMLRLLGMLPNIAHSSAPALILGESGTGKELLARELHLLGPRAQQVFVPINCGAMSGELLESELFGARRGAYTGANADRKGVIQQADGGTLFLDEIGDMSLSLQVKLLRFLQEGEVRPVGDPRTYKVNVRVVAATNRPLEELLELGRFRLDLYYRLNVLPLRLPPLRERLEDVEALTEHFLVKYQEEAPGGGLRTMSESALNKLKNYPWPGNIRELEGVIRRALVLSQSREIRPVDLSLGGDEHLQLEAQRTPPAYRLAKQEVMNRFEVSYVTHLLEQFNGNVPMAADRAGQDRKSFWRIMTRHGIDPSDFR